jgi:hypothetical protein
MTMKRPAAGLLALLTCAAGWSCAGPEPPPTAPPAAPPGPPPEAQATAAELTLAAHGPSEASGEESRRLIEWVRRQPERYVPALAPYLDLERGAQTDDEQARLRAQNAAMILVEHGGELGRALAVDTLRAILARQRALEQRRSQMAAELRAPALAERMAEARRLDRDLGGLTELRNAILSALRNVGDARAAGPLLEHLRDNPDGLQAIAVPYLMKTAPGDPATREALRALAADPQSSFYRNRHLEAFLSRPAPGEKD